MNNEIRPDDDPFTASEETPPRRHWIDVICHEIVNTTDVESQGFCSPLAHGSVHARCVCALYHVPVRCDL